MPIVAGGTPATAHDTSRTRGRRPSSAAPLGVVTTQIAAPSFCPEAFPAVTVASGSSRPMIGRSRARASRLVSGRMCSSRSTTVSPLRPGTVTGTISSANRPSACAAAARRCERTANSSCSCARDAVLPAQVLRGLDHAAGDGEVRAAGGDPAAGQRVVQQHPGPGAGTPAHRGGVERRVAHRLRATGEQHVATPGLHLHRRVQHGLQPRAAAAVDLHAGDGDREARRPARRPGRSPGRPWSGSSGRARRRRPRRRAARCGRAAPGSPSRPARGRYVAQRAAEPADRRPQRLADHRVTHARPPPNSTANGAVECSRTQSSVTPSASSTSTSPPSRTRKVAASVTTTSTGRCAVSG